MAERNIDPYTGSTEERYMTEDAKVAYRSWRDGVKASNIRQLCNGNGRSKTGKGFKFKHA